MVGFLTNTTTMSYAVETTPGVLPTTPDWYQLEPDSIGSLNESVTTTPRNPISKKRMDRKGSVTDSDTTVSFTEDFTYSSFNNFIEGFMYAALKTQTQAVPTSVAVGAYTHPAITAALDAGTLIYSRDFEDTANNGLKVVDAASTTTLTNVVETLVVDASPATGAKFDVVGFQGATGDIEVDASGDLISTIFDFTASDAVFRVGQTIYIGGTAANTSFATAGAGSARITAVAANKLSLEGQTSTTWATDAGAGKTIQILTGSFIRNVPVCNADFLSRTYQIEAAYSDKACTDTAYEYAEGCSANTLTINNPQGDKCMLDWGFIGLSVDSETTSAKSGNRYTPTDTTAFNTASDISDIVLAKSNGTVLATYFKDLTLSLDNGVSPIKVLGTLGAVDMNLSNFVVTGSATVLFDDLEAIKSAKANDTVSLSWNVNNGESTIYFNIPSMTLGTADKSFDRDEEIKLSIDGNAFEDDTLGFVLGITIMPYTPKV